MLTAENIKNKKLYENITLPTITATTMIALTFQRSNYTFICLPYEMVLGYMSLISATNCYKRQPPSGHKHCGKQNGKSGEAHKKPPNLMTEFMKARSRMINTSTGDISMTLSLIRYRAVGIRKNSRNQKKVKRKKKKIKHSFPSFSVRKLIYALS